MNKTDIDEAVRQLELEVGIEMPSGVADIALAVLADCTSEITRLKNQVNYWKTSFHKQVEASRNA